MRTDCQRILIHLLLLISHKSPAIAKRCSLPYLLPVFDPLFLSLISWSKVIGGDYLRKEDRGDMILVVVHTE